MMKKTFFLPSVILLIMFFNSCTRVIYDAAYPTLGDGKYDSEFPYRSCSEQLEDIIQSVKMINSIAYYTEYLFSPAAGVTYLTDASLSAASSVVYFNETAAGTATVIYNMNDLLALITCNHIVNFPDTVITYYENSERIKSAAVLRKQTNYVNGIPNGSDLDVLITDEKHDLALIGRKKESGGYIPVFTYPRGKAARLEWGSFVYLLGYPKGNKMITRGIVSSPNRNSNHEFLVDALFNKGFSGGLVLAIKDGVPNFELVGIAKSVAADFQYILTPETAYRSENHDLHRPYTGDIFIQQESNINYGITNTTSIESIGRFLKRNELALEERGYRISDFFKAPLPDE